METREFRELAVGDVFRLEDRLYEKRAKYSARLLRDPAGKRPSIKINRMIHPDSQVSIDAAFDLLKAPSDA